MRNKLMNVQTKYRKAETRGLPTCRLYVIIQKHADLSESCSVSLLFSVLNKQDRKPKRLD